MTALAVDLGDLTEKEFWEADSLPRRNLLFILHADLTFIVKQNKIDEVMQFIC